MFVAAHCLSGPRLELRPVAAALSAATAK